MKKKPAKRASTRKSSKRITARPRAFTAAICKRPGFYGRAATLGSGSFEYPVRDLPADDYTIGYAT